MSQTIHTNRVKQPKVFPLSVMTALFERSGYYALTFILVLYIKEVYSITDGQAFVLFGVFNALVFLTPAVGGYLADNILGIRRTMLLGLSMETIGLLCLALPQENSLYFALSCIIVGVGFFKVGPTDLMGRSYHKDDPRIDSGFTLYYMMMNIGAFFSPIAMGYLQRYCGWHVAFLFATIVMFLGILAFLSLRHRAAAFEVEAGLKKLSPKKIFTLSLGIIAACAVSMLLLNYTLLANVCFIMTTAGLLVYFANEIRKSTRKEKLEIVACLILIFIGMLFFIMYFQFFMSVTLFIKRSVSHDVFGFDIPTSAFLALNNIWIIAISPALVFIYNKLSKYNKNIAITNKFALGIFITSLCFVSLYISTFFPDKNWQVSSLWIVLAIFLYSLGELLVSALGVAMVTKIAPKRMYGIMMGAWFLIASSLASAISSSVANLASVPNTLTDGGAILSIYNKAFFEMGMVGIFASIVVFIIGPYVKRMANLK